MYIEATRLGFWALLVASFFSAAIRFASAHVATGYNLAVLGRYGRRYVVYIRSGPTSISDHGRRDIKQTI